MNISRLFVLRPVATSLLMIALVLVGLVAVRFLPVSSLPDVDYPTALYMSTPYDSGWRGQGSVRFGTPTDVEAPYSAKIARTLAKLPLLELRDAIALHSAGAALYRNKTRRLDRPAPTEG